MLAIIGEALYGAWPTFLLFLVGIGLFVYLEREAPSWYALAGIAAFTATIILMSLYDFWKVQPYPEIPTLEGVIAHYESKSYVYDIWGTGNHSGALVYAFLAMGFLLAFAASPDKRPDFLACAIMVIVVFAEGWTSLMENVNCNFLQQDIPAAQQTEAQSNMSKCERIYGWWYRYPPIIIEIAIMAVFSGYWIWAKRQYRKRLMGA